MFLLAFLVAGLAVGFLRGGRLGGLASLRLHWAWLIPLGLLLQVLAFSDLLPSATDQLAPLVHLLSYTLVLAGIAANVRYWPLRPLLLGTLANYAVIVANGGYMPAAREALLSAGLAGNLAQILASGHAGNNCLLDDQTRLPLLADVFAVPQSLPLATVFSTGDLLIGLGALFLMADAMVKEPSVPSSERQVHPAPRRPPRGPGR